MAMTGLPRLEEQSHDVRNCYKHGVNPRGNASQSVYGVASSTLGTRVDLVDLWLERQGRLGALWAIQGEPGEHTVSYVYIDSVAFPLDRSFVLNSC